MIEVSQVVPARPDALFAVLSDGWTYAGWVVGNSHIREVDPGWPAPGTRIHHSVGAWPLQLRDVSKVIRMEPGRLLELEARLGLFGSARVRVTLAPAGDGRTQVTMAEETVRGPLNLVPAVLQAPLLRARNSESLARLADLAVGREVRRH